ncbi:MAG TPA: hypothetical protein VNE58_13670 [Casimicrobiaceae bacterium]|nr:hypothetical protein [Casimicrobiaceae bacterium]
MPTPHLTAWLRFGASMAAAAGVLSLAACGGGSGAPNNMFEAPPSQPAQLSVVPRQAIAYAGTPLVLSISGGTPPYTAFSANPTALPVPQNVSGNQLVLLANNVSIGQPANVTIRDSGGQTATSEITVNPAVLLPGSITITPNATPCATGQVCSGQTAAATVRVTGPSGTGSPGRQIRFDVVQGTFSLATTNPGSPLAQTQTVVSDANGDARVIIFVPVSTPTQIGLLRATDVATGGQVTAQFVIAQETAGEGVLAIAPSGQTTITGPAQGVCSSGVRVSYYLFGGTPPYRIVVNFPDVVTLVGNPVTVNGGGFDVITNGACFTNLTFAITDATGRTLTQGLPTVTNQPGTQAPAPPTPVPPLAIAPNSVAVQGGCGASRTYQFVVTGGTAPYSVVTAPSAPTVTVTGAPVQAAGGTFTVSGPGNISVSVADTGGRTATATVTCTP